MGRSRTTRTAGGERIYAIGDVHGCHDLLKTLINLIIEHWEGSAKDFDRVRLIFLGDLIDRGPASDRCLDLVHSLISVQGGAELVLGNHEDMMLESVQANPAAQRAWMANGGLATLESFGIAPPRPGEDAFDLADRLTEGIPAYMLEMLRSARFQIRSGDYLFVHAGVRPGIPLRDQDPMDLYSIREEFTGSRGWHGAMVVHGHSIVEDVEIHRNRIACDTGAYRTGKLSCICLQGKRREIIST